MAVEIKVPSPGESISEVQIARWIKNDGDYVEKDEEIAEIDSDKATLTLVAEADGVLKHWPKKVKQLRWGLWWHQLIHQQKLLQRKKVKSGTCKGGSSSSPNSSSSRSCK